MKKTYYLLLIASLFLLSRCSSTQITKTLGDILGEEELTSEEVARGLKEALEKGITTGANMASQVNGYYENPEIKIPLPDDVQKVESRLRQLGLGNTVDRFILTMNRAAEKAADEAKPIFIDAIRSMTIQDAWGILKGSEHSATNYLKDKTYSQLKSKFQPIIGNTIDQVNVTRYYSSIANVYNKIPGVDKIETDLDEYVTRKAIDGLFTLIAEEEENIRENPVARTTELLKKVFSQAN